MKIKIEREGEQGIAMEVELPAKLDLKGMTNIEFEKYLNVRISGEGKVELGLPLSVVAREIRLGGDAVLEIESEGVPAFKIPKKLHGEVMKKILEELPAGKENAVSSSELASKLGLSERQLRMPLGKLAKKQIIGTTGEKRNRKYYKLGIKNKDPREQRSFEIPVVEK